MSPVSWGSTKAKLLQSSSNFGSLPGKEQTRKTDSPFLKTQSWTDLGGSESAASYLSQVDEERPAKFLAATKRRRI